MSIETSSMDYAAAFWNVFVSLSNRFVISLGMKASRVWETNLKFYASRNVQYLSDLSTFHTSIKHI